MMPNINIIASLLVLLYSVVNVRSQINYCQSLSSDGKSCLQCNSGYNLVEQSTSTATSINYCQAQCPSYLYRQTTPQSDGSFPCSSICQDSQLGDDVSRTCQSVYACPNSFQFGQSFHSGKADNLIFYISGSNQSVQEIITSSPSDPKILVWDSQTGSLVAQLVGHSYGVVKIFFIDNTINNQTGVIRLMSLSSGGEIIIWNYLKASIISKVQIQNGQLQSQSQVELNSTSIISFGQQGEFYVINYSTLSITKFVGHSQIVEQVYFIKSQSSLQTSDYLISASKDKTLLLWMITSPNSPTLLLSQFSINSFQVYPIVLTSNSGNSISTQFMFAYGVDVTTSKITTKIAVLDNTSSSNFKTTFTNTLQSFYNHQNSIINLIIDQDNFKMITYSASEIFIYDSTQSGSNLIFSLNQQANLSSLLPSSSIQISNCQLFNNKMMITTLYGEILLYSYTANVASGQPIIASLPNNYIVVQREKSLNSVIKLMYSQQDEILYAYANQVVAFNYPTRIIKFIINNFPNPAIAFSAKALKVDFSVSNYLIAAVSVDGRGFVIDKLTYSLLTVLVYSKNINIGNQGTIIAPTSIVIVMDSNVCISYQDTAFVCYDPITAVVNYSHSNNVEVLTNLQQDYTRNFVFAFGQSQALVYDLTLKKVHSQINMLNQFYIFNFQGQYSLLYTSTPSGNFVKFKYPDLSVETQIDYSYLNTNGQQINGWRLDNLNYMCIAYFNGGLVIMMNPDMSLIRSLVYKAAPTICGINYPYIATCATSAGGIVAWYLNGTLALEQQLLDFPITYGMFSFEYGQAFMQIDYAAFGSGIMVGDLQYLIAQQNFNTAETITKFIEDDERMQIYTVTDSGSITAYHFTPQPSIIVQWQQSGQNQIISSVAIFQEDYKYIILSLAVTIYDYLSQTIYKVRQLHNSLVTGVIIDKPRFTIITFNSDTSKNLFYWSYITDTYNELVGHTATVNGGYLIDTSGTLVTYSQDGQIIVWNYLTQKIITKLNNHNLQPVSNLFIQPYDNSLPNGRILFISKGGNGYIQIYDYTKGESIASIPLNSGTLSIVTDNLYQRIFLCYTNTISVYSYVTGLKITELLGFDGDIGSNILFYNTYIVAGAQLVIQSFDRQSLNLLNSGKSTQTIYQMSLLGSFIGIISNGLNDIIKLWNYQTGVFLQDMTNQFYPIFINGIISEQEANIFIVTNIQNQIFTFNPYTSSVSKVEDFMILPIFSSQMIQQILIDFQSNLLIAYNSNEIMQWKYYCYMGQKGQTTSLPSNSNIVLAYHPVKDFIFYADFERNVWLIEQNTLTYVMSLLSQPLQSIIVGNVLIIREAQTIKSYDQSYNLVSTLSITSFMIFSDTSENNFFFIINMTQDVVKVTVDQSTSIIKMLITYQQIDGVAGSSSSRVVLWNINSQFSHVIIGTENGTIMVVNYSSDQRLAVLTNHTKRVTQIKIDSSTNFMVSSSVDGSLGFYQYAQTLVSLIVNIPIGGQIDQLILDMQYGRLMFWINLQTKVFIFSPVNMQMVGSILAPGDIYVKLIMSATYNKYAIYNYFQINIYERSTLSFISSIRFPSDLYDIIDVQFMGNNYILIRALSSVRIYQFVSGSSSILINKYVMTGSQIVSNSYNPTTNVVNLKGLNYQTSYNYTFILYPSSQSSTSYNTSYCYTNVYDSKNYFTLRRSIDLQENSFTQFGLNNVMQTVKYNIIYSQDLSTNPISIYYPSTSSGVSQYQNQFIYEVQQSSSSNGQRIVIDLSNASTNYSLNTLKLNKFTFYIEDLSLKSNPQPVRFHQNTKTFIFNDGLVQGSLTKPIITQGFQFENVTTVIMEKFEMITSYFDGTYTSLSNRILQNELGTTPLFSVSSANYVYIKSIVLTSCIFKNQNVFLFNNVNTIVIEDIQLTDVSFKSTYNSTLSLFKIINSQNIQISNIRINNMQNTDNFIVFQMMGNLNTNINQFSMQNVINSKILYYSQTYSQTSFEYKVKSDVLTINSVNILNVKVDTYSQFDIQAYNLTFNNITANNVVCTSCIGSVISVDSSVLVINNSTFQNNFAYQGGAISLSNCYINCLIKDSLILNNSAVNGGGLLLQNTQLDLQSTSIIGNAAFIGGGVRYSGIIPQCFQNQNWSKNKNIINQNVATIYGNNLASYPRSINIQFQNKDSSISTLYNQTLNSFALSYEIDQFMSGDNFLFSIQLIDEEGKSVFIDSDKFSEYPSIIQEELNSYQIQCYTDNDQIQLNSETLISLNKYNSSTSSFVFDKLVINSKPLGTNHFYMKTNVIQLPSAKNASLFVAPSFSAYIVLGLRKCKVGEIFMPKYAGQLEYCKQCPLGTYSLADPGNGEYTSLSCQICPTSAVSCEERTINLKNGYWRDSNNTDRIVECSNSQSNCNAESPTNIEYCAAGYIGPLCEQCDILGKVWGQSYSKVGSYQCEKCDSMEQYYLLQALAFIIIIGYVIYGVRQSNYVSMKKIIGYYLRMMGIASVGTSDCEDYTSIFLKFLMHYLYISKIVNQYNFQLPFAFSFIQMQLSTPVDSMKYVPDCYKSIFNTLKPVYSRQVVSQIIPMVYLTASSLLYFLLVAFKRIKHNINYIFNGLVFMFIFIQPDLLSGIISASSCRSIGDKQYVTDDLTQDCLTREHIVFVLSFCLIFFLIWAFILPLILFLAIYRVRNNLEFISSRLRYGFIYQEYKLKIFYWEFIKITLKLLITLVNNFFSDQEILKSAISTLFILGYVLLSIKQKPYLTNLFNQCDQYSHIILIIILQFNVIINISSSVWINSIVVILFFIFHYSYILFLIYQIFRSKITFLAGLLIKKFPSMKTNFPLLFNFLDIKDTNRVQVYRNWKKVWTITQARHFSKRRDEHMSMVELVKKRDQSKNESGLLQQENSKARKSLFNQINTPNTQDPRCSIREDCNQSENGEISIEVQAKQIKESFPVVHSIKSINQRESKHNIDDEEASQNQFFVLSQLDLEKQITVQSPIVSYNFQEHLVKIKKFNQSLNLTNNNNNIISSINNLNNN